MNTLPSAQRSTPDSRTPDRAPLPPLYRSEGFAEDLLDGQDAAAAQRRQAPPAVFNSLAVTLLCAAPLSAAVLGMFGVIFGSVA